MASHILDYGTHRIYFNPRLRYPDCVVEPFTHFPDTAIHREMFKDKFKLDPNLDPDLQPSIQDYEAYITEGGSYGHNAPAAFHKSTPEEYLRTFWLSNICPQEGTFNAGLWQLVENWTLRVIKTYGTVTIFTGSIGGTPWRSLMIPSHLYKIVVIEVDHVYYESAYLIPNRRVEGSFDIGSYATTSELIRTQLFESNSFDLGPLLVPLSPRRHINQLESLASIRGIDGPNLILTKSLRLVLRQMALYESIIYAPTLADLEKAIEGRKLNRHNQIFYEMARTRLCSPRNSVLDQIV